MNQVTIVGRLVRTPELRQTDSKKKMTFITVAVNRSFKNVSGEYETDFIDCVLWDNIASNTVAYCVKGDIISVRGRLQTRLVEKNNERRHVLEVVGERISFISSNASKTKDVEEIDEETAEK